MAISANNVVVAGKDKKDETEVVAQTNNDNSPKDGHTLIVNGKPKKIGRKSAFLLDMLTLDDE